MGLALFWEGLIYFFSYRKAYSKCNQKSYTSPKKQKSCKGLCNLIQAMFLFICTNKLVQVLTQKQISDFAKSHVFSQLAIL